MRYSEAVDFLDGKIVLGVKPSLDRIQALCSLMGDPQNSFDAIQVTGTNGKTSVSHMISSILRASGFSVGLYTSPHLETVRERVNINGKHIPVDAFAAEMSELAPRVEEAEAKVGEKITYFEVVTALAYRYFRERQIDVAVLEAGMGGSWDATNVVDCEVAVITNVDLDHTAELGSTREEIAREKIGIVNEGSQLITAEARREILMMMAERCEEVGAEMRVFGRDFRLDYVIPYRVPGENPAQFIAVRGLEGLDFKDIKMPMLGKHQAINAAVAVAAAQCYTGPREKTDIDIYRQSLSEVAIPGRLEVVAERPLVVLDGAHNPLGMERLAEALGGEFDYDRLEVVVAILEDKDARTMLKILGSVADELVLTENRSARSLSSKRLAAFCRMERIEYREEPNFARAMSLAYNNAGPGGMVCVSGSLYTVAEARIFLRHQKESKEMRQDR